MPLQPWLPLAIVAPRSRLLWSVNVPAFDAVAVLRREIRHQPLDRRRLAEFVAQQPAAVVGDDQLDVHAALEQRGERPTSRRARRSRR